MKKHKTIKKRAWLNKNSNNGLACIGYTIEKSEVNNETKNYNNELEVFLTIRDCNRQSTLEFYISSRDKVETNNGLYKINKLYEFVSELKTIIETENNKIKLKKKQKAIKRQQKEKL